MSLHPDLYTVSEGDRVEVMLVTNIPYVFEFTIMVNTNSVTAIGTYRDTVWTVTIISFSIAHIPPFHRWY